MLEIEEVGRQWFPQGGVGPRGRHAQLAELQLVLELQAGSATEGVRLLLGVTVTVRTGGRVVVFGVWLISARSEYTM